MPIDPPNPFAAPVTGAEALTPDAVSGELAGRGTRLAASILDNLIGCAIVAVPVIIVALASGGSFKDPSPAVFIVGGIAVLAIVITNCWLLHTRGQTMGKIVMKTRIVRMDGKPTTWWDTIGKRVIPMVGLGMIPIVGGLLSLADALFIFREDRRTLHDHIAGTEVITLQS